MTAEETKAEFSSSTEEPSSVLGTFHFIIALPCKGVEPTNKQGCAANRSLSVWRTRLFLEGPGRGAAEPGIAECRTQSGTSLETARTPLCK